MKKFLKPFIVIGLVGSILAGCTYAEFKANLGSLSVNIGNFNKEVAEIAPVVGKDLVLLGDTLVQIECSPAMQVTTSGIVAAIGITAPSDAAAGKAVAYLQTNAQLAAALCPIYQGIKASIVAQVAKIPAGAPKETVPMSVVTKPTTLSDGPVSISGSIPTVSIDGK